MALQLKTSHALYPDIVELIGLDNGVLASAKTARTFSPMTGASYPGSPGTYGRAARSNPASGSGIGAFPFSPYVALPNSPMTLFVVVNTISTAAGTAPYPVVSSVQEHSPTVGLSAAGKARAFGQYNTSALVGVEGLAVVTGGAHSFAVVNTETSHALFVDGSLNATGGVLVGAREARYECIGGLPGQNAVAVDFVWAVWFKRVLTAAEIAGLHASLGGNNTFGLVESAGGIPTVTGVTVAPSSVTVAGSASQQFSATVAGTNSPSQAVTWSASAGSINTSGLFTAPAAGASIQTITITATSVASGAFAGTATVTVPASGGQVPTVTSVAVSPATASVSGGTTRQFSATVSGTNSPSQAVVWTTSAGTISTSGLLTAPAAAGVAQTLTVTATSTLDGTKSGTAIVTVPAVSVAGQMLTDAMINNTGQVLSNISVRWSWYPGGRIGALAGITPLEGVGVTDALGQILVTGLPAGAGLLLVAQWITDPTDDNVYYKAGVIA